MVLDVEDLRDGERQRMLRNVRVYLAGEIEVGWRPTAPHLGGPALAQSVNDALDTSAITAYTPCARGRRSTQATGRRVRLPRSERSPSAHETGAGQSRPAALAGWRPTGESQPGGGRVPTSVTAEGVGALHSRDFHAVGGVPGVHVRAAVLAGVRSWPSMPRWRPRLRSTAVQGGRTRWASRSLRR